jgi:cysteine desulfuration protein SufE
MQEVKLMSELPPRLQEIVEDFSYCQGREKLEYLLQLSETLKPLPSWLHDERANMDEVHECMTPVFIFAEEDDGKYQYHFDIPPESPTVRGFAALLQQGLDGAKSDQIQAIPNEFYLETGLQEVLTAQRLNGMNAIIAHMKTLAS